MLQNKLANMSKFFIYEKSCCIKRNVLYFRVSCFKMFTRFGIELPFFYCILLLFGSCNPLISKIDLTAAVGLCLEKMSKEELDETTDVLRLILPGVSCRFLFLCFLVVSYNAIGCIFSYIIFFSFLGGCQAGWKALFI